MKELQLPEKFPQDGPNYSTLAKISTIASAIVGLTLLGYWMDQKFHTPAIFTLLGASLGILYSLYEAWVAIKAK